MASSKIIGKWSITVGALSGFSYEFKNDGTFNADFPTYNIKSSGNYKIDESVIPHLVDLEVTSHTYGEQGTGILLGIFDFEDEILKMKLNEPNKERWKDTATYYYYERMK